MARRKETFRLTQQGTDEPCLDLRVKYKLSLWDMANRLTSQAGSGFYTRGEIVPEPFWWGINNALCSRGAVVKALRKSLIAASQGACPISPARYVEQERLELVRDAVLERLRDLWAPSTEPEPEPEVEPEPVPEPRPRSRRSLSL